MVADVFTQTISGKMVSLTNPKPEQIDIHDMVYSLCRINRFNGHTKGIPYSVANHSWFAARQAGKAGFTANQVLDVLLHDAHEYILGDITTPASQAIGALAYMNNRYMFKRDLYRIKAGIDEAIYAKLGIARAADGTGMIVRAIDLRTLETERRDLLNKPEDLSPWRTLKKVKPFKDKITPIEPNEMFSLFYRELTRLVAAVKQ